MSKWRLWWRLCLLAWWAVFPGRAAQVATNAEPDIRRDAAVTAIEKVMPSVVNIATETLVPYHDLYDEIMGQFFGWHNLPQRVQRSISLGSGVIIDEDGYLLTNVHVVRRANRVQVKLWDGREYEAEPCSYAEASDVALIRLKAKPGEKFKAIQFAADDDLLLGETVLALGNPFGLGGSVTKGILSSKNRRPARPNEPLAVEDWLQTDAAINPGNSGGPLVNLRGELIGLNVALLHDQGGERSMGVSFSIPVKQVSAALSRSFTPEATEGMWFGAQFRARSGPLMISEVQPTSPADKAGLRVGDRVLEINGQVPRGFISSNRLLAADARHEARLTVRSGLEHREVTVRMIAFEEVTRRKLGLTLDTPPERAAAEGLPITEVEKGSPAGLADLQHGYLLAAVDGQRAASPRMVGELLSRKNTGDAVALTVTVPRRLGRAVIEFRQGTVEVQVR